MLLWYFMVLSIEKNNNRKKIYQLKKVNEKMDYKLEIVKKNLLKMNLGIKNAVNYFFEIYLYIVTKY